MLGERISKVLRTYQELLGSCLCHLSEEEENFKKSIDKQKVGEILKELLINI